MTPEKAEEASHWHAQEADWKYKKGLVASENGDDKTAGKLFRASQEHLRAALYYRNRAQRGGRTLDGPAPNWRSNPANGKAPASTCPGS